ncbi:zinc finger MYM-type protein 1-like [Melanaphis sacchari]|uniref:zinc finger MYM-type protein 1-like n=1 Tax=Melanaphis sacchari TaxID=742174 RepID=UPI000DC1440D|nr:zinc finger MYM-type protein 1-like [Melanaphis sacchari]
MAGKYNGVQSKICQINELARFVPCTAHSLNLIGFHAANVTHSMVTFFGVVQQIFVYFSGSTSRWERLNTVTKVTLKLHSNKLKLPSDFPETHKCKKNRTSSKLAEDEECMLTSKEEFERECNMVFDSIISQIQLRFEKLNNVISDFSFLIGKNLQLWSTEYLKKCSVNLALKYSKDLDAAELCSEIECFKFQAASLISDLCEQSPLEILNLIHIYTLNDAYPNIEIALRIFLTLPVSVASCERSFNKLKIIKNYLRSSIGQDRLSNMAIISIESETANHLNYDDILEEFASIKSRKINF